MSINSRKIVNTVLFAITLLFIGMYIYKSIDTLSAFNFSINYLYIALAIISVVIAQLLASLIWFRLAHSFGLNTPLNDTVRIWLLSRFGRYIPGKVPFLLLRINLYKDVPAKSVTLATVTEYISTVAAALLVVTISLSALPEGYTTIPWYLNILIAAAIMVLLKPGVMGNIFNRMLTLFGKNPIQSFPSYKTIVYCVLAYILPIAFHGLGLFLVFNSMEAVNITYYPIITGLFYASSLVGLLAFFAPGGIGVREGLMMVSFSLFLDKPVVIVAAIAIRFITILAEVILLALFSVFHKKNHVSKCSGIDNAK